MSTIIHETTESRFFKVAVFIFTGIVVGVSIANLVYFNRLRDGSGENTDGGITSGEATAMFWVNLILLVITGILFIWSIYKLAFSQDTRRRIKKYAFEPQQGAQMGYTRTTTVAKTTQPLAQPRGI